jgi:hypothetical protein
MLARLKSWFSSKRHKVIALGVAGALICGGGIGYYVGGNPNVSPPPSINATCSSDVSTALNAWLATLSNGAQVNFPSGACYEVNESLSISGLSNVIVNGNGSTFENIYTAADCPGGMTTPPTADCPATIWQAVGGYNISFENMTIEGNSAAACNPSSSYEWQFGIAYNGTQGGTVNNVTVDDVYGDFVETQDNGSTYSLPTTNILIENSTFNGAGRMGIGVTDASGVTVKNNSFDNACGWMVDIEPDTSWEYGQNVYVIDNTLGTVQLGMVVNYGSSSPANSGNIVVTGNTMTQVPQTTETTVQFGGVGLGTSPQARSGVTFNNNYVLAGGGSGVEFNYVNNVTMENNTILYGDQQGGSPVGFALFSVNTATIENNIVGGFANPLNFYGVDFWGGMDSIDAYCSNITQSGNT